MAAKKNPKKGAKAAEPSKPVATPAGPRPRLTRLSVANFRAIGRDPVTIELDDIVVLVGPNNAGKSSILRAYEVVMAEGSTRGKLTLDDFPNGMPVSDALPTIELTTIVHDLSPGEQWIAKNPDGESEVRERWQWRAQGDPVRRGYNVREGRWATDADEEKVPWGAAGVANSRRPEPHVVDAFASPEKQAEEIGELLKKALEQRVKQQKDGRTDPDSKYAKLVKEIVSLQEQVVDEVKETIETFQKSLTDQVQELFPGQSVTFDPSGGKDAGESLTLFKATPKLKMGPSDGFQSPIERQGSGARRALLWAAIRMLAETGRQKKQQQDRPFVLLLDEPEICLHPNAVREASRLLYDLPRTNEWQVMLTTHSPCFIDFGRDHTSVVRVERSVTGAVAGTTIFRPSKASFDEDDKKLLKLLNMCDPYVAEFFFGGRTVLVEGDTEYTAFRYVASEAPDQFKDVHVVRARGKATLIALAKILNQFQAPYAILHDSDRPLLDGNSGRKNSAWKPNMDIRAEAKKATARTRVVASITNFETAFLNASGKEKDKPYHALLALKADATAQTKVRQLLEALIDFEKPVPEGALEWNDEDHLRASLPA